MIKRLVLKYKWHLLTFIFAAALFYTVFIAKETSSTDKVIDWVADKRLNIVEDSVKLKKKRSEDVGEEIEEIEKKIKTIRDKGEADDKDKERTLKDLSSMWSDLGY